MSEFAFVIASNAKQYGIISREVYLLLLCVTALSLFLTPLFWWVQTQRNPPDPRRRKGKDSDVDRGAAAALGGGVTDEHSSMV